MSVTGLYKLLKKIMGRIEIKRVTLLCSVSHFIILYILVSCIENIFLQMKTFSKHYGRVDILKDRLSCIIL